VCREISRVRAIDIDFTHDDLPASLPKDVALALFRVLQEALSNAVKHSGARQVYVTLHASGDEIRLEVIDDGNGFDSQAVGTGLGLVSMRERLRLVNGEFVVESQRRTGTRICARVPLLGSSTVPKDEEPKAFLGSRLQQKTAHGPNIFTDDASRR
jgi:signal transduction histidine kinase